MNKITINKGWFRSAGYKYGWMEDGLDIRGVGINKKCILRGTKFLVEVDGIEYVVDSDEVIPVIKKYKSFMPMRGGTRLCVIPKDFLKPNEKERSQMADSVQPVSKREEAPRLF